MKATSVRVAGTVVVCRLYFEGVVVATSHPVFFMNQSRIEYQRMMRLGERYIRGTINDAEFAWLKDYLARFTRNSLKDWDYYEAIWKKRVIRAKHRSEHYRTPTVFDDEVTLAKKAKRKRDRDMDAQKREERKLARFDRDYGKTGELNISPITKEFLKSKRAEVEQLEEKVERLRNWQTEQERQEFTAAKYKLKAAYYNLAKYGLIRDRQEYNKRYDDNNFELSIRKHPR